MKVFVLSSTGDRDLILEVDEETVRARRATEEVERDRDLVAGRFRGKRVDSMRPSELAYAAIATALETFRAMINPKAVQNIYEGRAVSNEVNEVIARLPAGLAQFLGPADHEYLGNLVRNDYTQAEILKIATQMARAHRRAGKE